MEKEKSSITAALLSMISQAHFFLILLGILTIAFAALEKLTFGALTLQVANEYYRILLFALGVILVGIGIWVLLSAERVKKAANASIGTGEQITIHPERSVITSDYFKLAKRAWNIDVLGLTLKSFRDFFGVTDIIQLLRDGKKLRILILFPTAYVTQIRQMEEKKDNSANFEDDIETTIQTFEKISAKCKEQGLKGALEVRFYDTIPYFAYFRADNSFVLGPYYHHKSGLKSQSIFIEDEPKKGDNPVTNGLTADLKQHFETLWADNQRNTFCVIGSSYSAPNRNVLKNESALKRQLK